MYFPWVGLIEQVRLADVFVNYADVQFSKGSFVNRVQVKTAQGTTWMSVPLTDVSSDQAISEVRINNDVDWRRKHRELLSQAYAKARHRDDMLALVDQVFSADYATIGELSHTTITALCHYFSLEADCRFIDMPSLNIAGRGTQRVLDTVLALEGDTYITGHGAKNYLDHERFEQSGVRVEYMNYEMAPYKQLHGDFTPYVSALDLVANIGKDGVGFLRSGTLDWKEFLHNE